MRKAACFVLMLLGWLLPVPLRAAEPDPVPLHIYSATDTPAMRPLIALFERRTPGVDVVYHEFTTNELYRTVLENRDSADFEADMVISPAMDHQVMLVNMGLAHAFTAAQAVDLPDWARWRRELYGFTYEPAAVIYNKAAFRDRALPRSHSDLASMVRDDSAFFDGRIGTYDIHRSGIGYLFAAQDAIQGYQSFRLTESFGRARGKTFCCTSEMLDHVARGDLVLSYNVIGSYALAAAQEDPRIGVHFFDDYTLVMTRSAFILKSARHKAEAAAFIAFLLSREGQAHIARRSSLIPIRTGRSEGDSDLRMLGRRQPSFIPIKLGTGLLAYLDSLKKRTFLQTWDASVTLPPSPDSE